MCHWSTIVAPPKKALFDVISLIGDLVITYRTNVVIIVPRAFRKFHDQCPVHIRILTIFTGIFRVKGGGIFRAITFWFLSVVFSVVVALLGVFSFTAIRKSSPPPLYLMNFLHWSRSLKYFLHFGSLLLFLSNHLGPFCQFLIKPLSTPKSARFGHVIVLW